MRSFGKWTLTAQARSASAPEVSGHTLVCVCVERQAEFIERTDRTCLEHEFPDESIRHSVVQVALQVRRASARAYWDRALVSSTHDVDGVRLVPLFRFTRHGPCFRSNRWGRSTDSTGSSIGEQRRSE